jgi:cytochrome c-type biogenesis protein CcmE
MKKSHIIAIIIIAVAIGAILSTVADSSTYASFAMAEENPGKEYHVVGKLEKDSALVYNPQENANLFTFYLKDTEGTVKKVLYHGTKPQDFERSEQVVLVGKMKEEGFQANTILMKCPSKYNDGKPAEMKEYKAES